MKLYTKEQVIKALFTYPHPESTSEELLKDLTPIELPSDEEIEERFDTGSNRLDSQMYESGFRDGAKWMKQQILNQNK